MSSIGPEQATILTDPGVLKQSFHIFGGRVFWEHTGKIYAICLRLSFRTCIPTCRTSSEHSRPDAPSPASKNKAYPSDMDTE